MLCFVAVQDTVGAPLAFTVGSSVWVEDEKEAWVPGVVVSRDRQEVKVKIGAKLVGPTLYLHLLLRLPLLPSSLPYPPHCTPLTSASPSSPYPPFLLHPYPPPFVVVHQSSSIHPRPPEGDLGALWGGQQVAGMQGRLILLCILVSPTPVSLPGASLVLFDGASRRW